MVLEDRLTKPIFLGLCCRRWLGVPEPDIQDVRFQSLMGCVAVGGKALGDIFNFVSAFQSLMG